MREYDDRLAVCPHCGYRHNTSVSQSYHLAPGSILYNRYIVGKVLGFGGFGVTYIGWDYLMRRRVAIKEYLPSEFSTRSAGRAQVTVYPGDKAAGFRDGLFKTIQEARCLAQFGSVNGIVQVYDCFEANGTSYIVMEYLEGITLKKYLADHGRLTMEQALPVVLQIAYAMEQVHQAGILHRDIAPDNVCVLNPEEPDALRVKLLDFGAARYASGRYSKSLSSIVKYGYTPIEQYSSGGNQGVWSDVYALAATFYKMLTGITPEDAMERDAKDEVKLPSKLGVDIPKSVENALMNAMNVEVGDRTRTMGEFIRQLQDAAVERNPVTVKRGETTRMPWQLLAVAGTGVAAAALAAVLIGAGILGPDIKPDPGRMESGMTRVPNVVNYTAEEADRRLAASRLEMVQDKAVFSDEIPENLVCYQEIKENTQVEKYTQLLVWISKGEQKAMLPFVKGLAKEDAGRLLEEAGFTDIEIVESQERGAYNSVLAVSEEQGANLPVSRRIVLTVCANREQQGDSGRRVLVPDLSGMQIEEAQERLEAAKFRVNWVEQFSMQPEETVIRQEPGAGTEASQGTYVTLYVSKGPEVVYMVNVRLMEENQARQAIGELGLSVGTVRGEYHDTVAAGKVIGQSIASGEAVKKGSEVSLTISKGRDPEKVAAEERRRAAEETVGAERTRRAETTVEASRQAAEAAAAEASRQAEKEAAARASRQAAEAAAAEASRQAAEAAAAEASRQAAAAASQWAEAVAEASRQAAEAAAAQSQTAPAAGGSNTILASGRTTSSRKIDLRNKSYEAAVERIDELDLVLGRVTREYSDTVEEGHVISQSVSRKESLKPGTVVNLVVSLGPAPAEGQE